jgi:type I restriction enzyme, S subunit
MSTALLFEQFATLATAPDGIARLRELILQLAVQGKLGTQNAGDEPASILLKEILKERHLSSNKKNSNIISSNDIPFEIPENWIFAKVGDISNIIRGISYTKGDEVPFAKDNYAPLLRSNNINNGVNFEKLVFVPKDFIEDPKWIKIGDLIVAMSSGSANLVGKTAQIESEFKGSVGAFCGIIRPTHLISRGYLKYFFQCPYYRSTVSGFGQGIGINNLGINNLQSILLPLPPLTEQHRIVAKVDRLMALCDELEARQVRERAGCLRLATASLAGLQNAESPAEFERQWAQVCDAFNLILDCPDNIAALRQTILYLAVQGKLGTHDSDDEPADKLLKRIREENKKIILRNGEKKFKVADPVNVDKQTGEIPLGWGWAKLPEIVKPEKNSIKRGPFGSSIIKAYFVPKGYKIYEQKNAIYDNFSIGSYYINDAKFDELKDFEIKPNDIIISCAGTVGKLAIVPENIERGIINQALLKISLNNSIMKNEYFRILFASFLMRTDTLSDLKGTAMKNIVSLALLRQIIFPLPPLAEQHRIVAKVDALMALCNALESHLKERAGVQGKMAGAVVKSVASFT